MYGGVTLRDLYRTFCGGGGSGKQDREQQEGVPADREPGAPAYYPLSGGRVES